MSGKNRIRKMVWFMVFYVTFNTIFQLCHGGQFYCWGMGNMVSISTLSIPFMILKVSTTSALIFVPDFYEPEAGISRNDNVMDLRAQS
jgi:hypothetical protein